MLFVIVITEIFSAREVLVAAIAVVVVRALLPVFDQSMARREVLPMLPAHVVAARIVAVLVQRTA